MSPRLVMKRLQPNCPAQQTSQRPSWRTVPQLTVWEDEDISVWDCITNSQSSFCNCRSEIGSVLYSIFPSSGDRNCGGNLLLTQPTYPLNPALTMSPRLVINVCVTSIGDETFAIQLSSSANRPTTKQ
ncbi:hypothetical protein T265_14029, partial [Opisthorchis viverrini]